MPGTDALTISDRIYSLARVLRCFGWRVIFFCDAPPNIYGRCDYETRTLNVYAANALAAFTALLHEAGHAIAYTRGGERYLSRAQHEREHLAYLYGWALIKSLGAPVSKSVWREANEFAAFGRGD